MKYDWYIRTRPDSELYHYEHINLHELDRSTYYTRYRIVPPDAEYVKKSKKCLLGFEDCSTRTEDCVWFSAEGSSYVYDDQFFICSSDVIRKATSLPPKWNDSTAGWAEHRLTDMINNDFHLKTQPISICNTIQRSK